MVNSAMEKWSVIPGNILTLVNSFFEPNLPRFLPRMLAKICQDLQRYEKIGIRENGVNSRKMRKNKND